MNNAACMMTAGTPTLAHLFGSNGYRTAIFGKWHLGDNYPFRPQDRGFQEVVVHGNGAIASVGDILGNDCFDDTYWHNGKKQKYKGFCTDIWFDLAMNFMSESKDKPFFVYIPTNAAHTPFKAPESYVKPFIGVDGHSGFFGLISNFDMNFGRLMKFLDKSKLSENTILIYMSDNGTVNGYKVFNAGMRGKKGSRYDGGHRVPFMIRWPAAGIHGGKDVKQLAAHLDVWPTLKELCGLKDVHDLQDGIDLSVFLKNTSLAAKPRILVENYKGTVMTERWRLVYEKELYDIQTDPAQKNNIADQHPLVVKKLREVLMKNSLKNNSEIQRRFIIGSSKQNLVEFTQDDSSQRIVSGVGDIYKGNSKTKMIKGIQATTTIPVKVERQGTYRIQLRRWPEESGGAIRGQLAGEGKAIDIVKAHLRVQEIDKSMPVDDSMKTAAFDVPLKAGECDIIARFFKGDGSELGAYYVTVTHLK
jgi:arylsulfatase A-like enzyme